MTTRKTTKVSSSSTKQSKLQFVSQKSSSVNTSFNDVESVSCYEPQSYQLPSIPNFDLDVSLIQGSVAEQPLDRSLFTAPVAEQPLDRSVFEDSEISFTLSEDSEVISTNDCSSSAHCDTCTCFQEPVKVNQVSLIRTTMAEVKYTIEKVLPKGSVRDIILYGDKILETDVNGKKVYRDLLFKHFNSPQVSTRVVQNTFDYEMRPLSSYSKQDSAIHTYLNFRNGLSDYEVVMKYSVENDIKFTADGFNPTMIAFDVEAFHPTDKTVVPSHKNGGVISMICASFSKSNQLDRFVVYLLDQYKYNENQINEFIQQRRSDLKLPNEYSLNVVVCENQTIMACQFLDDVQACGTSLLYGFNSSATSKKDEYNDQGKCKERVSIGYDLPFIIHNSCRYTKESVEHGAKMFGKIGKQIKKIHWLPDTYILDCMVIFQNDRYFAMQLSDMPNRKLNSFLEVCEIPVKEDDMNIYQRMDQMRIQGSDQTACINYCLWDAFALTIVMNKIKYIGNIKANCEIFNIPLSWALHKNPTNWCTMLMLRRFYKAGFAFSYAKYPMSEKKTPYRGATTESCPKQLQMNVINDIAMWDFESLYPNAIISANLGIDSIMDHNDGNCFEVNLNFIDGYLVEAVKKRQALLETDVQMTKEELKENKITASDQKLLDEHENPNVVFFSKKPSLFAIVIEELLKMRLEIKAQMKGVDKIRDKILYDQLDARQNAIKIFVNSIYGLSGAETFQLYDMRVASACTSVSRQLTYFARKSVEELQIGQVVFRDTDSCGVMVSKETILQIYKHSDRLNALVNQKLQQSLGTNHIVKFVLEAENFQEKTYYPKAKKAYARIECNVADIIANKPLQRHLKIKGVSWSLMSKYGKEFFRHHTEYILLNLQNHDSIETYVNRVLREIEIDIATLVETKNYSELARKYHKQIKNSAGNKTAQYLRKTFNVSDNEIQILPVVKASKLKSKCVIPAELAHKFTIDQNQLLEWFISPFQKFYGKHEYNPIEYDETEMLMECRLASNGNYHTDTVKYSYSDMVEKLENKAISYNEVIQQENKLFFDIDDALNSLNFEKCLDLIEKMICKFRYQSLNVDLAYTKTTSTTSPHSYHLVYQIRASLAMNKYIAQQINREFGFQIIDEALYSKGKSLRLPQTPKFDRDQKKLVQVYHNVVRGTLEQMFVTDIESVHNSLSNAIGFIETRHKELGYNSINLSDKYIKAIKLYIPFEVEFGGQDQGSVKITPLKFPYKCPVCSRDHSSVGMVAYLKKDGFLINCWSNKTETTKKSLIKHQFEKQTAVNLKQSRINQLKEFAEIVTEYRFKKLNPANITFQHNSEVKYDLSAQTTFVRSQMMTGKTKQQIKLTATGEYNTILALSFRRTFARDNAEKNSFVNYESIKGDLNLVDYPHLILQVDSLARLDMAVKPKLLIIDEIESTLEQLLSIKRDTTPYILYKFIELLQSAEKVLFLDAELEQSTIECMSQLIGTDNYKVFVNTYKPKTDSKIIIHDYVSNQKNDITEITNTVKSLVEMNKRVVVFSTSRERASDIKSEIPAGKIVKYYDGEDARKYDSVSMAKIKSDDFQDVNKSWADCDVLIYTGTLTAGISFELNRFDTFIGIYSRNTCSPLGFTQGLHRVRNFADKQGHLYLEKEGSYLPETAYQITDNQTRIYGHTDLSEVNQFKNWLEASTNQSTNNRLQIAIRNLKNMGYTLEIAGEQKQTKSTQKPDKLIKKADMQEIANAKITLEDLTELPRVIKSTALIMANQDDELHQKYQKTKLFKSFYPKPYSQESIDHINSLNSDQIDKLYAERPRIAESNKIKNLVEKYLSERPELEMVQLDQINSLMDACKLEAKQNIKAQLSGTVQKDSALKFHQQIYLVAQAIKVRDSLKELTQTDLENAVQLVKRVKGKNDTPHPVADIIKSMGISLEISGVHQQLNQILKYIDLKIEIKRSKTEGKNHKQNQVRINGKKITINSYELKCISAQTILDSI